MVQIEWDQAQVDYICCYGHLGALGEGVEVHQVHLPIGEAKMKRRLARGSRFNG